jgi:hypothetical protein
MHPDRHALRFGVYAGAAAALASRRRWPKLALAGAAATYSATPVRRAWRRLPDPRDRAIAAVAVPALMAFVDSAKMAGYAAGLVQRLRAD